MLLVFFHWPLIFSFCWIFPRDFSMKDAEDKKIKYSPSALLTRTITIPGENCALSQGVFTALREETHAVPFCPCQGVPLQSHCWGAQDVKNTLCQSEEGKKGRLLSVPLLSEQWELLCCKKSISVSQLHPAFESKSIEIMLLCHLGLFMINSGCFSVTGAGPPVVPLVWGGEGPVLWGVLCVSHERPNRIKSWHKNSYKCVGVWVLPYTHTLYILCTAISQL